MKTPLTPETLLSEISQIQRMERGKLCVLREGLDGPYYNCQSRENGRNFSRYVPRDKVEAYEEAIAGYQRFVELMEQYAQSVIVRTRIELAGGFKKKEIPRHIFLAQEAEIGQVMAWFEAQSLEGQTVAQLEVLIRTALFKSAAALIGWMLQQAAARVDAQYQPQPGLKRKGVETIQVQGIFGTFELQRDYYYHAGKKEGHYPADAALGLEVGYTPALAKLICLEGADASTYLQAERHLENTGGMAVSARQIQRVVQRVGSVAQSWQEREAQPDSDHAPIL